MSTMKNNPAENGQAGSASANSRPMTMIQALRSAMDVMLERDDNVVVFGQDVVERLGQNLLQALHLGLQGLELRFALQGLCGRVGGGVRRLGHGQAAIGVELGNGEIRR